MTEQTPTPDEGTLEGTDTPDTAAELEELRARVADLEADLEATTAEDSHAGYAVYDETLERFVSPVAKTKAKAEAEVTKAKGHRYTTKRV